MTFLRESRALSPSSGRGGGRMRTTLKLDVVQGTPRTHFSSVSHEPSGDSSGTPVRPRPRQAEPAGIPERSTDAAKRAPRPAAPLGARALRPDRLRSRAGLRRQRPRAAPGRAQPRSSGAGAAPGRAQPRSPRAAAGGGRGALPKRPGRPPRPRRGGCAEVPAPPRGSATAPDSAGAAGKGGGGPTSAHLPCPVRHRPADSQRHCPGPASGSPLTCLPPPGAAPGGRSRRAPAGRPRGAAAGGERRAHTGSERRRHWRGPGASRPGRRGRDRGAPPGPGLGSAGAAPAGAPGRAAEPSKGLERIL